MYELNLATRQGLKLIAIALIIVMGDAAVPFDTMAQQAGTLGFTRYEVTDPNFNNMRVASLSIPAGWHATSQVRWDFTSANYPVKVNVRIQSPDGKMWINMLPMDAVYWMDRFTQGMRIGQRSYGAVYMPNASVEQAMERLVVKPYYGKAANLKILNKRPVDTALLAKAFNFPNLRGDAMAMRVRYTFNRTPIDEEFFTVYTPVQTLTYNGPQGTSHEYHRSLIVSHSVGATDGLLPTVFPLLGTVAASIRPDENFQRHVDVVRKQITAQYNAALKRGYSSIAAAGQLSKSISAKNDVLLTSMQQTRVAQNQADARRRTVSKGNSDSNDGFSQYIRGTTRMNDPYWGSSERDSNFGYHWTDGQGNYRASNDSSYNPNIASGGGSTWQRMEPAR